jgi:prophage DNA circulation protein
MDDFFADIRQASFRGVPFGVLDASDGRGRKLVVHEYPLRDLVYVEDMGRAKRTIKLTAFVVGADWAAKRDALVAALEEPGPGTLIHPWLGSFYASLAAPAEITPSAGSLKYASFTLQFVEADEPAYPGITLNWPALSAARGLLARAAACASLVAAFILKPVVEEALEVAKAWAESLPKTIKSVYKSPMSLPYVAETIAGFKGQLEKAGSLAPLAEGFWPRRNYALGETAALAYREAEGLLGLSMDVTSPKTAISLPPASPGEPWRIPSGLGFARSQIARNELAIADFQREMSGIAGLEAAAWAKPASSAEAKALRELALDATDCLLRVATSSEAFMTIQSLGTAAQKGLAEAARRAPKVARETEPEVGPALAIAWKRTLVFDPTGSVSAAAEDLIARNKVRHPGFVPAGELEFLRG